MSSVVQLAAVRRSIEQVKSMLREVRAVVMLRLLLVVRPSAHGAMSFGRQASASPPTGRILNAPCPPATPAPDRSRRARPGRSRTWARISSGRPRCAPRWPPSALSWKACAVRSCGRQQRRLGSSPRPERPAAAGQAGLREAGTARQRSGRGVMHGKSIRTSALGIQYRAVHVLCHTQK